MPNTFSRLVDALLSPNFYPHPVGVITTIETHSSIVILTGEFAYKLKKPVDFGFLDFSTLEKRQKYTQMEYALNRRTAPELYLGVLPVYEQDQNFFLATDLKNPKNPSPAVAYLLKMQQFDPNKVLSRYLQHHPLDPKQITHLASQIATLHQHAETVSESQPWGKPKTVLQPMLDNFPPLNTAFIHPETQYKLKRLVDWTHFQFNQLEPLLADRRQQGFVCACHGDLHLDNITLINETPTLFDGIEFNEAFRWIDRMSDLAFLLVDLEDQNQHALAWQILNQYLQQTGDYEGLVLLPFYQVYRALVKAKITALRAQQLSTPIEQQLAQQQAYQFILQAEDIAYQLPQPQLILLQGVSGSGKSYLANQLAPTTKSIILSSDIERKKLFGLSPLQRPSEEEKAQLYSQEMNQTTYQRLHQLANTLLAQGRSVIIDATNLQAHHRVAFYQIAQTHHAQIRVINLLVPEATLRERIKQREQLNNNPSDATLEVMQAQSRFNEPATQKELGSLEIKGGCYTLSDTDTESLAELKIWLQSPI